MVNHADFDDKHTHTCTTYYFVSGALAFFRALVCVSDLRPKAYFNFWKGDAMMCGMFDANSCEAAAKQGVFKSVA